MELHSSRLVLGFDCVSVSTYPAAFAATGTTGTPRSGIRDVHQTGHDQYDQQWNPDPHSLMTTIIHHVLSLGKPY